MAQAGSFVAARTAKLPVVDRIFARVGASDNIARGQSTFMVEMQETANILHSRDVAQSRHPRRNRPRHRDVRRPEPRLGGGGVPGVEQPGTAQDDLRDPLPRAHRSCRRAARASRISTSSCGNGRTTSSFCGRSIAGRSDRSYGIQVARLAGLPATVVARAREILNGLERDELSRGGRPSLSAEGVQGTADGLFQAPAAEDDPVLSKLRGARRESPDADAGLDPARRAETRGW